MTFLRDTVPSEDLLLLEVTHDSASFGCDSEALLSASETEMEDNGDDGDDFVSAAQRLKRRLQAYIAKRKYGERNESKRVLFEGGPV